MQTSDQAKRILCYGDSNTRGRVPSSMGMERFLPSQRWPGILQKLLGEWYEIIEEGLWWRTTMFDDPRPEFPERNGLKTLPIILESHLPLDLVILMLGTTDTKEMMNIPSEQSAEGVRKLVQTIQNYKVLKWSTSPKILIIVPPIVKETADFASKLFKGATQKCTELIPLYKKISDEEHTDFLDPTGEVVVDEQEGVHMTKESHQKLAELVYEKINGFNI